MNQQDKSFMITFTTVLSVLVILAIVIFLVSQLVSMVSLDYDDESRRLAAVSDRIKPVARVAVTGAAEPVPDMAAAPAPAAPGAAAAPAAAPAAATPAAAEAPAPIDLAKGEEVYSGACLACHATGAAGAPMITDKAAWEPRVDQGFDVLVSHAVNGYNAMPAKGGNPSLTENDIRNSIAYMLAEVGIDIDTAPAPAPQQQAEAAPAPTPPPAPEAAAATPEQVSPAPEAPGEPPVAAPAPPTEAIAATPQPALAPQAPPAAAPAPSQPMTPQQATDAAELAAMAAQEAAAAAESAAQAAAAALKAAEAVRRSVEPMIKESQKETTSAVDEQEPVLIIKDETLELSDEQDAEAAAIAPPELQETAPEEQADTATAEPEPQSAAQEAAPEGPILVPIPGTEMAPGAVPPPAAQKSKPTTIEEQVGTAEKQDSPVAEGQADITTEQDTSEAISGEAQAEEPAAVTATPIPAFDDTPDVAEEAPDAADTASEEEETQAMTPSTQPAERPPFVIEQDVIAPGVEPRIEDPVAGEQSLDDVERPSFVAPEAAPKEDLAAEEAQAESMVDEQTPASADAGLSASSQSQADNKPEEVIAAVTEPAAGVKQAEDVDLAQGEQLYKSACVACHLTGVAGAPKLSDKRAWMPRLKQGFDVLVQHAINGYRAMPPKGGRLDIPDEEIMSAVGYMMSRVK